MTFFTVFTVFTVTLALQGGEQHRCQIEWIAKEFVELPLDLAPNCRPQLLDIVVAPPFKPG